MDGKHAFRATLQAVTLILVLTTISAFAEIPDFLWPHSSSTAPPLWVSEKSAATQEGAFRWELFSEISQGILNSYLENQERERSRSASPRDPNAPALLYSPDRRVDCQAFFSKTEPHYLALKKHGSLRDLADNALLIATGEISDITQGFYAGFPTSLVTTENPRFLKQPDKFSVTKSVHVSFPHTAISVGGYTFCTHEPSFPSRPEPGDRLLMFAYDVPESTDLLILEPFAAGLIIERTPGDIEIPDKLNDDLLLSSFRQMDEVEAHLREILPEGVSR